MKVLSVFGTRPEAIKMIPIVKELSKTNGIESKVCVTGQHRQMLDQVLNIFNIKADFDLNLMNHNQTLTSITSNGLTEIDKIIKNFKPNLIIVQGDTTTAFSAALSGFYHKVPIAHVEAGLRTGNIYSPWPEEVNRKLISSITSIHFAPTEKARLALKKEGVVQNVYVTGNTVIDSLLLSINHINNSKELKTNYDRKFDFIDKTKKMILVTGHRRESFGDGFNNICNALAEVAKREDIIIVYPVHLNPNVQEPVNKILKGIKNIFLIEPQDYLSFIYLMSRSYFIITDSGGVQEEAPSLKKPVLVIRETTERTEALDIGAVKLIGCKKDDIVQNALLLLSDKDVYKNMISEQNPYGDGTAAKKITDKIRSYFKVEQEVTLEVL